MKKFSFFLVFVAVLLFVAQSCKRKSIVEDDTPTGDLIIPIEDLVAPAGFNFQTNQDLYVRVKVANPLSPTTKYLIKIYSNVPGTNEIIASGLTNTSDFEYATSVRLPAGQEFIWIEKISPDGTSEFLEVPASTFVSSKFDSKPEHVFTFQKTGSGMDCSSKCDNTYNNHSGNLNLSSKGTYCITGTFNGSITVGKDVYVKICASGNITNLTLNDKKSRVYILEKAELEIANIATNNKSAEIRSWSDSVIVTGSMTQTGKYKNYGKLYVKNNMTLNSSAQFSNYGFLDVGGNVTLSNDLYNYHFMTVGGNFTINSNGYVDSYCNIDIDGNLTVSSDIDFDGIISVGGNLVVNSNGDINFYDGGLVTCENLTLNNDIEGKSSKTSVIKVNDRTVINSNGEIKGKLDLCDNDGVETNNGKISSPAKLSCATALPKTTCNPNGFNNVVIQDDDNDGIANGQDEYPNDADKAFNSYYPSASTYANIGFEDLWPNKGDFDFNDMVIAYNVQKVLNADEKVVEAIFKVNVRSVGGSFDNGFGIRLDDIASSAISEVSGYELSKNIVTLNANKTEAAQDKAVIICFDSPEPTLHRATGSFFNTIKTNAKGTSDTLTITVKFSTPQDEANLAASKLNPFIFTNQRRGYEVHLSDFVPTSLADKTLFGTGQDASNASAGKYYKTANNLPWAILIEERFDYPEEKAPINVTYKYFNEWAISGGVKQTTWFKDLALHRELEKVFE